MSSGQFVRDENSNAITAQIVDQRADFVLAVKGNQPALLDRVQESFKAHFVADFARVKAGRQETQERGRDREERRFYEVCLHPRSRRMLAAGSHRTRSAWHSARRHATA